MSLQHYRKMNMFIPPKTRSEVAAVLYRNCNQQFTIEYSLICWRLSRLLAADPPHNAIFQLTVIKLTYKNGLMICIRGLIIGSSEYP